MRINELREKIDKFGQKYDENFIVSECETFSNNSYITVYIDYSGSHYTIATIMMKDRYIFSTIEEVFDELLEELQEELFEIFVEFARTPTDEREEAKKYQYRLKETYWWILGDTRGIRTYLNVRTNKEVNECLALESSENTEIYKTEFTDEEIKEVTNMCHIDLEMFDKIEVTDD